MFGPAPAPGSFQSYDTIITIRVGQGRLATCSGCRRGACHRDLRHSSGVRPVRAADFERSWQRRPAGRAGHRGSEPDLGFLIALFRRACRPDRCLEGRHARRRDLHGGPAGERADRQPVRRVSGAGADWPRPRQRRHLDRHRRGWPCRAAGPALAGLRAGDKLRLLRAVRASSRHADADERAWMAVGAADPVFPDGGDDGGRAWHANGTHRADRRRGGADPRRRFAWRREAATIFC